jgi:hypothetical protein
VQTGEGSVIGRAKRAGGNLDGFLARLHHSQQNEGKAAVPLNLRSGEFVFRCMFVGMSEVVKSWSAYLAGEGKRVKLDRSWIGSMTTIEGPFRWKRRVHLSHPQARSRRLT